MCVCACGFVLAVPEHPHSLTCAFLLRYIALRGTCQGLYYSFPVICTPGDYKIVEGLSIDSFSAEMMEKTKKELLEERDFVKHLIKA